jgi:hypothetical protein
MESKASKMLNHVTSRPFGDESLKPSALIGYGIDELGLPIAIEVKNKTSGDPYEDSVEVGVVFGLIAVPDATKFSLSDDGWILSWDMYENSLYCVGEWWPALAYLRIKALIDAVPETFKNLGLVLGEILDLEKALGRKHKLSGETYHPNADAAIPSFVDLTPVELLKASTTSLHSFSAADFSLRDQGDQIKYELRFGTLPGALSDIITALDKRAESIAIDWASITVRK